MAEREREDVRWQVTLNISERLYSALHAEALRRGVSRASVLQEALEEFATRAEAKQRTPQEPSNV